MELRFGVLRWWYGGIVTNKKEVAFGDSNAPRRPQHSNLNTEWHVQK